MTTTVTISASTIHYPVGGGHFWVFLNWALGLKANGCHVRWLEYVDARTTGDRLIEYADELEVRLAKYDLADGLLLYLDPQQTKPPGLKQRVWNPERAGTSDMLLNLNYGLPSRVVSSYRRSALVDIDPGLLQMWLYDGRINLPRHSHYFTTGETVGTPEATFPDCGIPWRYTPPCVAIDYWPAAQAPEGRAYTTVSHWSMGDWVHHNGEDYSNDKRSGFLPYLELPTRVNAPLELALCLSPSEEDERRRLLELGWSIVDAYAVSATPWDYQNYIQRSRGEFTCVKPSCVRLQNAWVSDRTLCYLASGKPAIVQHTGKSRILPDHEGILRFRTIDEAIACVSEVENNYDRQSTLARRLAEERFGARAITQRLLEFTL
ncbi:MAG: hypothetical protein KJO98_00640 [Rhodothermia bacterium]|nr:hypothetical protein [Rhodothermia bacterium]